MSTPFTSTASAHTREAWPTALPTALAHCLEYSYITPWADAYPPRHVPCSIAGCRASPLVSAPRRRTVSTRSRRKCTRLWPRPRRGPCRRPCRLFWKTSGQSNHKDFDSHHALGVVSSIALKYEDTNPGKKEKQALSRSRPQPLRLAPPPPRGRVVRDTPEGPRKSCPLLFFCCLFSYL